MSALVVSAPNRFEVREVRRPVPRSDEALVRVVHSAICGSDLKLFQGKMEDIRFPLVPGHEWSGEVVEVSGMFQHLLGRPVVSDILQACEQCDSCRAGYRNLCDGLVEPGISVDGGFAQFVTVRAKYLKPLPPELPLKNACMVEPLSVVLYALKRLDLEGGESVLIIGAGAIGLLLTQVARLFGAAQIVVADHHDARLAVARQLGADQVINAHNEDLVTWFLDRPSLKPNVVFEASGSAYAFAQALEVTRPAGRIAVIGYAGRERVSIAPAVFMRRLLQVRGVLSPMAEWEQAIDLLARKSVRADALLTHRFPLNRFAEAFDLFGNRADGIIRAVIEPQVSGTQS